jgi:cell division protein FtsI/penicillin-binding protein 2
MEELARTVKKYNGAGGSIIIMDPASGAIYALANYPTYDPNTMEGYNKDNRRNRAVTDMYEPGSTFKIFTMAAYLEEFPDGDRQKVFCGNGQMEFFGRIVHDHEKYGWLTAPEVIKYSSNTGIVTLALMVPQEKIYNEYIKFGFGKKTNTDMPDETPGMLRNFKDWDNTTLTSMPYGQEVAITPIQLMRAYAAIANGGYLVTPHVIDRIEKNGSTVYSAPSGRGGKIIGDRERGKMISMLKLVTEKDGSGKKAAISGYSVAGKTGTAQKQKEKGRGKGYEEGKYVASFIGFLPADKPEVLTLVVIDEPKPNYYGSEVAAPAFKNINSMVITGLHVAPQESTVAEAGEPEAVIEARMPDFYMADFTKAKAFFAANKIKFQRYGFGKSVIGQSPEAGKMAGNNGQVYVLLGDKDKASGVRVYMPDVRGLSIRKTLEILGAMGIKAKCTGSGYAVKQEPKPGVALQKGKECLINFEMKDAT